MKKTVSKILSLLLCGSMGLALVACDPDNENGGNKNAKNSSDSYTEFIDTYVDTVNRNVVSDTDTVLYSNGVSDYKILISRNADSTQVEKKAAEELQFFFLDATGIKLPIVYDTDESVGEYDTTKKYISIGYTSFYKASPMNDTLTFSELGNDGFKIQTYGNVVIMNAAGNNGIVYSAYGFLERNMDYRYYAQDEWTITSDTTKNLKNMDVVDVPEFDSRFLDTATNSSSTLDWAMRLRHHGSQGGIQYGGMEGGAWKLGDQSLCLELLVNTIYQPTHPDWYTGDGGTKSGQMCIGTVLKNEAHASDGLKPLDEMWKNLKNYILKYPDARIFMLGINDNATHQCKCDICAPMVQQIGYSGQMCLLANALMDKINEWQDSLPTDDSNKDREINLSFFAYLYTIDAPVNYDAATDSYSIIQYDYDGDGDYSDLALKDNIIVRIAPIASVNMHTHYDRDYNEQAYTAFETWSLLSPKLAVWDYGTTFSDYISPYPDWGVIQDDFKYFRSKNVTEILTQLPAHTSGTSFYALMLYLRSQLMWDMDQNVEWLIQDFFEHYYGPQAYESMYGYFCFLRNYFNMADGTYRDANGNDVKGFVNADGKTVVYHGYIYETFTTQTWFPYVTLMQLKSFFSNARAELELVKDTEPKYQKYLDRVNVESLFSLYIDLKCYASYYSNAERSVMVENFASYAALGNLTQFNNSGKNGAQQVADFIANQRKAIS